MSGDTFQTFMGDRWHPLQDNFEDWLRTTYGESLSSLNIPLSDCVVQKRKNFVLKNLLPSGVTDDTSLTSSIHNRQQAHLFKGMEQTQSSSIFTRHCIFLHEFLLGDYL